eukprot:4241051-Pyramimonas_sp.AAC.1
MEIDEVAESGIQTYLHGVFRAAPEEAPGGARTIDYCLVSEALSTVLTLSWDSFSPWALPHTGLLGTLDCCRFQQLHWVLAQPPPLVRAQGPDLPWETHLQRVGPLVQRGMGIDQWQQVPGQ